MRRDIEFDAEGVTLRGWLYLPDGGTGAAPVVVIHQGISRERLVPVCRSYPISWLSG